MTSASRSWGRRAKRLVWPLLALAAVTLGVAAYLFLFCVALESACHMHDADACVRLEHTLRLSRGLAFAAHASLTCAVVIRVKR